MKMQRFLLTALAAVVVSVGLTGCGEAAGAIDVRIDGTPVAFTQETGAPFIDAASRTQVPLRVTMEAYGCQVDWDGDNRIALVEKDGVRVEAPIGASYIVVDGRRVPNDTAALIQDGRTYLPIRAVLEAFGGYVSWDGAAGAVVVDTSSPVLKVFFFDVGQGDAILLDMGKTEVLIDGGDNKAGGTLVQALAPHVDGTLEYVIATHPDADHVGGLDDVLAAYQVGEVIDSGYTASSATYRDYMAAVAAEAGCVLSYDEDRLLELGSGAVLQVMELGDDFSNPNDSSVVAQLSYGGTAVLFTGDLSQTVEVDCLARFGDVDVLKVGHHGSASSTCDAFLDVVKPEYGVVSYGVGNSYGHPTAAALERLLSRGVTVYGTGKSGDVVLSTNGKAYSFNISNGLTMADAGGSGSAPGTNTDTGASTGTSGGTQGVSQAEAACVANSGTGKFHTLTCRYAAQISQGNLLYFAAEEDAVTAGFEACKVCH